VHCELRQGGCVGSAHGGVDQQARHSRAWQQVRGARQRAGAAHVSNPRVCADTIDRGLGGLEAYNDREEFAALDVLKVIGILASVDAVGGLLRELAVDAGRQLRDVRVELQLGLDHHPAVRSGALQARRTPTGMCVDDGGG
jgi:hypothetical protein